MMNGGGKLSENKQPLCTKSKYWYCKFQILTNICCHIETSIVCILYEKFTPEACSHCTYWQELLHDCLKLGRLVCWGSNLSSAGPFLAKCADCSLLFGSKCHVVGGRLSRWCNQYPARHNDKVSKYITLCAMSTLSNCKPDRYMYKICTTDWQTLLYAMPCLRNLPYEGLVWQKCLQTFFYHMMMSLSPP